jgi:hypothetical protein
MARKDITGSTFVQTILTTAIGDVDTTTMFDAVVPGPNAYLRQASYTTKTAGATTGTFSVQVMRGPAGATAISPATAVTFIDADAATGIIHGQHDGGPTDGSAEGDRIGIKTVKTGTVSTGVVMLIALTWKL